MKILEGVGWKNSYVVIKKFQLQPLKVYTFEERGVSLLNQQLSIFKSKNPLCTPFKIILQDFTIATKPASLLYSTKNTKILGLYGKGQISSVQSAELRSLVTFVNCMSPTGHFIPPLPVFPRKYMKPELMNGTPPGSTHACHPSGWLQSEIFTQWFLHFIKNTKPPKKKSYYLGTGVALFTHTRNLDQPSFSSFFGVHICCVSPCIRYQRCAKPEPIAISSWWNIKKK